MSEKELAEKLREMYTDAPAGDSVAMIHLFGIKYADYIIKSRYSKKEIAKAADLPESYGTEIHKGVKLAKYVTLKN